jgi:integrase
MARQKLALTDAQVAELKPHADGREITCRTFGVPGLMLRTGSRKRTWELRIEAEPKTRRVLGTWPAIKVAAAADTARTMWKRHKDGQPVDGPQRGEDTIASAWVEFERYLEDENRSPKTLLAYKYSYQRLSESVKNRPLHTLLDDRRIMKDECARIRKSLSSERRGGQAAAASSAGFVSALFGYMRDTDPTLLGDPVSACQTTIPKRNDLPILSVANMPAWLEQVRALKNPIVQEALLLTLLSGLRRSSLESLEWKNLDLRRGCLFVEVAKGGKDRSFDLILSRPMLRCLWRARRAGRLFRENAKRWVFPGEAGHISGNSLTKYDIVANHGLRRGFATAGPQAGVDEAVIGRLMQHGGKSITARYIRDSHLGKMLASAQADISTFIVEALGTPRGLA